jgi:5'-3' exonuclease
MFRVLFACRDPFKAQFLYQQMLFGSLRRLHLDPDDIVILALDSPKGSWRKDHDNLYKANRKEQREEHVDINWNIAFNLFDKTITKLYYGTSFHVIQIDKLEADDIIAYGCRYFKDNKVIIVSADSDYEMLTVFPNVKLFTPVGKYYKHVNNPHAILQKKINSEPSDNLVSPLLCAKDYERRNLIVNLMSLPKVVEEKIDLVFSELDLKKSFDVTTLTPAIRKLYSDVYNDHIKPETQPVYRKKYKQNNLI